jgi:hypothetical protein
MLALLQNMPPREIGFNPTLCATLINELRSSNAPFAQELIAELTTAMATQDLSQTKAILNKALAATQTADSSARLAVSFYLAVVEFLSGNAQACKGWLTITLGETTSKIAALEAIAPKSPENGDMTVGNGLMSMAASSFVVMLNPIVGGAMMAISALVAAKGGVDNLTYEARQAEVAQARNKLQPLLGEARQVKGLLEAKIAEF